MAAVAGEFDGFIIDLWGVIHDGVALYPGVAECLDRLRATGRPICLLSNAPRCGAGVAAKLAAMGLSGDSYHHLVTSGDATRQALARPDDPWHRQLGPNLLHIGPERDRDVFADLERFEETREPECADVVLNTGPLLYEDTLDDYEPVLAACAARAVPMVCANPDLVVMVGDAQVICAGSLARRYEALGGEVRYHGKPHASVYRRCMVLMGEPAPARVLAIGDSLATDVAGARAAGMASALVTGGIHADRLETTWGIAAAPERIEALLATAAARPDFVLAGFGW